MTDCGDFMPSDLYAALKLYAQFDEREADLLRRILPRLQGSFPSIVEDFYANILLHPGTRRMLSGPEQVEQLKVSLQRWLMELFAGPHDQAYVEKRNRIGATHVRIGLPQGYVYGAMTHIRRLLTALVLKDPSFSSAEATATLDALNKVLDLDLALIAGSYHEAEKYQDLVEFAPDMIHQVDREGRLLAVNATEERRLGYPRERLLSMNFEDLVHEEDREEIRAHLERVFRQGESRCEVRLVTASGEVLNVEILATAFRDSLSGKPKASRAHVRDITERRRLERVLLEQASLAKLGEMAAVVAHEVKNPIAGISGALQVIGRQLPEGGSGRDAVKAILERLDALNNMVNDMLLFAKPTPPRLVPVPVLAMIEDAAGLLSGDAALSRELQVEVRGPPLSLLADPQLLKPVLLNLLLNAGQAMQGKGKISVSVEARNGFCHLTVSDHGPGIPPEVRDRLFEPFFSTKHRGTGLGLPIAKRIIEAHGGEIDIQCPAGGGTVVEVRLPLAFPEVD